MKQENRRKLATIKKKVIGGMYVEMSKQSKNKNMADSEYSEALRILGKALADIEYSFGSLD
ncbi:hypothetical protein [Paenibacillus macerans]|uniref:hypothetical protein n=1 Tax=Paenibacillus macerans TaxID=44252 RepID=UPI003D31A1CA